MTIVVAGSGVVCAAARGREALVSELLPEPIHMDLIDGVRALPVDVPAPRDRDEEKQRKIMSAASVFASCAVHDALVDAGLPRARWHEVGMFLGVGASGAFMHDIHALVRASLSSSSAGAPHIDLRLLGERGLAAAHPLLAFPIMNNFTLCHAAILDGLRGPNLALFSRGAGTAHALVEAMDALRTGACAYAVAGGADTALHPLTLAELRPALDTHSTDPVVGEGAAALLLTRVRNAEEVRSGQIVVERADTYGSVAELARALQHQRTRADTFVIAGSRPLVIEEARVHVVDVVDRCGIALAATPAIGWALADALLQAPASVAPGIVDVLCHDTDGASRVRLRRAR